MSKSIKVSDAVFETIRKYQGPRESYSSVIEKAFDARETIDRIKRGEFPPVVRREGVKLHESVGS